MTDRASDGDADAKRSHIGRWRAKAEELRVIADGLKRHHRARRLMLNAAANFDRLAMKPRSATGRRLRAGRGGHAQPAILGRGRRDRALRCRRRLAHRATPVKGGLPPRRARRRVASPIMDRVDWIVWGVCAAAALAAGLAVALGPL